LGWRVPTPEQLNALLKPRGIKSGDGIAKKAGFGWWREKRRLSERAIGENGMYL